MQLHHLIGKHQRAKRVGRGGKRGTTAGRGTKGQHSRAGRRIRPASRDLLIRIPKLRGFRNKPKSPKPVVLDLGTLARKFRPLAGKAAVTVDLDALKEVGLVPMRYRGAVKVLDNGTISFPVALRGVSASAAAAAKIKKVGGKIGG